MPAEAPAEVRRTDNRAKGSSAMRRQLTVLILSVFVTSVLFVLDHAPFIPLPTDDIFYVDAAAGLANHHFTPPTPAHPFHHYLRWPVVLPLALLFKIFGVSGASFAIFSLAHLLALQGACFFLARNVFRNQAIVSASVLAPLLLPGTMLPPLVRSEPSILFWSVSAIALLAAPPRRGRLFTAGFCLAIAADANQVALLVVPALLFFIHRRKVSVASTLVSIVWVLAGLCICMLSIMAVEGVVTGDPLIQFHSVGWWHLRLSSHGVSLGSLLDPKDEDHFLFGFALRLWRQYPEFVVTACLVVPGAVLLPGSDKDALRSMSRLAITSFLSLEMLAPFAVQKIYVRFVSIPCVLLALAMTSGIVAIAEATTQRWRLGSSLAAALVAAWLSVFNLESPPAESAWLPYYRDPIDLIHRFAGRRHIGDASVRIFFAEQGIPGLIPWPLAAAVYGSYRFDPQALNVSATIPSHAESMTFYISDKPEPLSVDLFPIQYESNSDRRRPHVYLVAP